MLDLVLSCSRRRPTVFIIVDSAVQKHLLLLRVLCLTCFAIAYSQAEKAYARLENTYKFLLFASLLLCYGAYTILQQCIKT
jgi:hypothetical protein